MKSKTGDFLFDDCPICQAQKDALAHDKNLSYKELQTAFKKADKEEGKTYDALELKDSVAVEKTLRTLIQKYNLEKKLSISIIKKWIYEENGISAMEASNKYQLWWTKFFKRQFEGNSPDFDVILEAFTDAWNYFPHEFLDGKSPREKYQEYYQQEPPSSRDEIDQAPRVHVGNTEMSWDEYEEMLDAMEKEQKPFKGLIKQILSAYKIYLKKEEKLSTRTVEKHLSVADIFFERSLHVGFVDFPSIRKAFITKEFPRWWQTHVMFFSIRELEIVSSLKKLFRFIKLKYGLTHNAFE